LQERRKKYRAEFLLLKRPYLQQYPWFQNYRVCRNKKHHHNFKKLFGVYNKSIIASKTLTIFCIQRESVASRNIHYLLTVEKVNTTKRIEHHSASNVPYGGADSPELDSSTHHECLHFYEFILKLKQHYSLSDKQRA
jgi:hypothetical protein